MALTAGIVGAGSAAVSAGNALFNGPSTQGGSATGGYIPTNPGYANAEALSALGTYGQYAGQLPGQVIPGEGQTTANIVGNPYANQQLTGANSAEAYGTGTAAPAAFQGAATLQGLGSLGASYAPQALANGFDPQHTLYNQQYQQNQDQTNAINSMNGVAGSPYGAGLATQSAQNFNTNWQNQQLGRQATAAGTYQTLEGTAGQSYTGAAGLNTTGLGTFTEAAGLPYNTYLQQQQNNMGAYQGLSSGYAGALGPTQNAFNIGSTYMGNANSAATTANNIQGTANANSSNAFSNLGQSLNGLSSLYGGGYGANADISSYQNPYSSYSIGNLNGLSAQPNFSF